LGVFLSFFLFLFSLARLQVAPADESSLLYAYYFLLGLEYLIFTFLPIFHQKSSKLSPKWVISSQNAERRENLTQSWERKSAFFRCNMMTS